MSCAPVTMLLMLSRRGYATAGGVEVHQCATPAATMSARVFGVWGGSSAASSSREIFWTRDPRRSAGLLAPKNRFADVDAAELHTRMQEGLWRTWLNFWTP
ncbi:hypothetical protein SETIT_7G182400v2 [Setaria italica]|uniref:Secreted protein n=1 Tax=Setaria italica TaxID=4555 RepID=K3YBT0_SETIT|nr:hypothetical protein SETIT_7G182400v2 [Setaria italica]